MFKSVWSRAAVCMVAAAATSAMAEDIKLPKTLVWTSFDVGSSGYNQSIAIGKALQDAYGVSLRVIATSTDQSRLAPARAGRVPFALSGSDVFYAFEGVLSYADPKWGPQPIKALSIVGSPNCAALGTAADAGIATAQDARGKRVGWVVGSPALQANVRAFLAFGGLTKDDVKLVELPSYAAAWQALANGQIDAMTGITTGGVIEQAAASPRGLHWVPLPASDKEGWKRLQAVNPHFSPTTATVGANLSKDKPLQCAAVPYPVLITYPGNETDLVYNVIKAIDAQVVNFGKAEPSASGWAAKSQVSKWVVPYHEGAIRHWREAGIWTDELQQHNDQLLKRQAVLAEAWKKMKDDVSPEEFKQQWLKVRAEALTAAGLPAYFK